MVVVFGVTNGLGHLGSYSDPGPHFGGAGVEYREVVNGFTVEVVEVTSKGLGHLTSVEPGKHLSGESVVGGRYGGPVVELDPPCGHRGSTEPG